MKDYLHCYMAYRRKHEPSLPSVETLVSHPTFRGVKVPTRSDRSLTAEEYLQKHAEVITGYVLKFCPTEHGEAIAVEEAWDRLPQEVPTVSNTLMRQTSTAGYTSNVSPPVMVPVVTLQDLGQDRRLDLLDLELQQSARRSHWDQTLEYSDEDADTLMGDLEQEAPLDEEVLWSDEFSFAETFK